MSTPPTVINNSGISFDCQSVQRLDEIETVTRLNNKGVACMQHSEYARARNYFRRSLDKASQMTFFMPNNTPRNKKKMFDFNKHNAYDEGMETYLEPVVINSSEMELISSFIVIILFNIGVLSIRLNKEQEAYNYFFRALNIAQQQNGEKGYPLKERKVKVSLVAIFHNIGYIQYRRCHYEEAAMTFKKALCLEKEYHFDIADNCCKLAVATTLNCVGVVKYRTEGKNTTSSESAEFLLESLAIQRDILGSDCENSKDFATTLNNLGRIHYMNGNFEEAREVYSRALRIRRRLFGDDHLDVAATLYNMAQTLNHLEDYTIALEYYDKFLTMIKKHHSTDHHRDVTNVLKCMAQIYHERKVYDQAELIYKKALFVGKASLGEYHEEISSIMNKLGNLFYEKGDYDNALLTYKQGLSIERKVLDSSHPNIVVTLTNIGQIHRLRGDYQAALVVHKEAVKIQRDNLGKSHPDVCATLLSVAAIHYEARSYMKALRTYEEVLRVQRELYGDKHVEFASTLNSVGLVLFKMECHEYALQTFKESLTIRQTLLGSDHRSAAVILYNIGTVYLELGDDESALAYYNETLRIERSVLGDNHADVALTLKNIGYVYQQRGELDLAIKYFFEALQIQQCNDYTIEEDESDVEAQEKYSSIAQTLNIIGNLYLQKGETKDMVSTFSEAVRQLREAGRDESDLRICGFNYYGISKMHPECASVA